MHIKSVDAKGVLDSRKEKTISVVISTEFGNFNASAPTGKSTGKFEVKTYKKNLDEDIRTLKKFKEYFSNEEIEDFYDLRRVEDIVDGHVGGNTIIALEYAALKAMAKEKKKQVWEIINPKAKNFPRLVGKVVGGGQHSKLEKKPDFQEFLLIPKTNSIAEASGINKKAKKETEYTLKDSDEKFKSKLDDENGWASTLNEKEILDGLKPLNIPLGIDAAASGFYKRNKYNYENPLLKRDVEEQFYYIESLIKNYGLFYIEDPFQEEDFESFARLLKKFPESLIVGDDLIVTNEKRLKKAIQMKSINAIIVKPNQCGSLLEVKRVCDLAKENKIKIVFSHRSGETSENILADLVFGFQADFFKIGIDGFGREEKIKRLIEIQKSF
jgi:enolase